MNFYELGKLSALTELGLEKDAGILDRIKAYLKQKGEEMKQRLPFYKAPAPVFPMNLGGPGYQQLVRANPNRSVNYPQIAPPREKVLAGGISFNGTSYTHNGVNDYAAANAAFEKSRLQDMARYGW